MTERTSVAPADVAPELLDDANEVLPEASPPKGGTGNDPGRGDDE